MTTRREADAFSFQAMLVLCAIWGLQQIAIKLAAGDLAPVYQAAARSGIAALLVGSLITWRKGWKGADIRETWRAGLVAGALFSAEFLMVALSLELTTAGHVSVFLYTAPVFSALGLHVRLPSERLNRVQWLGIAACFLGIAIAFLGGGAPSPRMLVGDALAVGAGMAWGATTIVVRGSRLSEAPAALTLFYQLAAGSVFLASVALVQHPAHLAFTATAIASVVYQGVVVSFATYLAWFMLLRRYRAAVLSVFSFMTPVFGVTAGIVILGEPLTASFVIGALLVLAGIAMVSTFRSTARSPA